MDGQHGSGHGLGPGLLASLQGTGVALQKEEQSGVTASSHVPASPKRRRCSRVGAGPQHGHIQGGRVTDCILFFGGPGMVGASGEEEEFRVGLEMAHHHVLII